MKVIYKYKLKPDHSGIPFSTKLPEGAELLHVGMQDNTITLWALVDKYIAAGGPFVDRYFCILMTGQETSDENADKLIHWATLMIGEFVLHVFEVSP